MTPFEIVLQHYRFPKYITPFPKQIEVINDEADLTREGLWLDMGVGKTFCATVIALYRKITKGQRTIVIMPPILIPQWAKWLCSISPSPHVVAYRGTPKQRAELDMDADFLLVGIQIFKKDLVRIKSHFQGQDPVVILDEATFAANPGTDNHDQVFDFCRGRTAILLSGTPANKPSDAYGLIKFTAPGTYRNKRHFENLHVADRDFFGNPRTWQNLDVLRSNLLINSKRLLLEDIYPDIEEPLFVPVEYQLEDDHYKLYRRLSEEELLKLPDGGKIDATTVQRLRHALGQIVVNHDHFSGDPKAVSAGLKLIEEKLDELGDGKLVVFADYRMTVSQIVRRFAHVDARAINSEVSETRKQANLEAFKSDPACRLLVVQFVSGGKGLDGLQHVCNHCLFIEPCQQPRDFHQAVARLKRLGQTRKVVVYLGVAQGTLQVRGAANLLNNDDTLNLVVRNAYDLRTMIFGG